MTGRRLLAAGLAVAVVAAVLLARRPERETASPSLPSDTAPQSAALPRSAAPARSAPSLGASRAVLPAAAAGAAGTASAAARIAVTPPSVSALRDEVQQDPHVTPISLLRFGLDLGERMEQARASEGAARELLGELKGCALPDDLDQSPVQARVLCLSSAEELAQKWPDLRDSVSQIMEDADPAALALHSKYRSLLPLRKS